MRKDGAHNIAIASIVNDKALLPRYYNEMQTFCGPMWNRCDDLTLWQIKSGWSTWGFDFDTYSRHIERDLSLLKRFTSGRGLSEDEYAHLAEKGYIKGAGGSFELAICHIKDDKVKKGLLDIGAEVKARHHDTLSGLKETYTTAVLKRTPTHLRKIQAYVLQFMFKSDGWYILHSIMALLQNGKLKPPTEEQAMSLTTLLISGALT